MRTITLFLTTTSLVLFASVAPAQMPDRAETASARTNTSGLHLGLSLNGTAQEPDGFDQSTGGGLGLRIGYGITPNILVYLGGDAATMDDGDFTLAHGDLGLRYTFLPSGSNLAPYLDVAYSSRIAEDDYVQLTGFGFSLGGGLQVFLSRPLALDVGLKWTGGSYDTLKDLRSGQSVTGNKLDVTSARFTLGLSWFPMLPR
jgi:opacity protein-like surface antigen